MEERVRVAARVVEPSSEGEKRRESLDEEEEEGTLLCRRERSDSVSSGAGLRSVRATGGIAPGRL